MTNRGFESHSLRHAVVMSTTTASALVGTYFGVRSPVQSLGAARTSREVVVRSGPSVPERLCPQPVVATRVLIGEHLVPSIGRCGVVRFSEDKQTVKRIAKHLGQQNSSLRRYIADAGSRRPTIRERGELRLSLAEREEISSSLSSRSLPDTGRRGVGLDNVSLTEMAQRRVDHSAPSSWFLIGPQSWRRAWRELTSA